MPLHPLPPWFLDPSISDAELQRRWAAGAEEAVRRLRERVDALRVELQAAEADLAAAEAFAADATAIKAAYAPPVATIREVPPALPRPRVASRQYGQGRR